jgi:hypothetical protein
MQSNSSVFQIPELAKREATAFGESKEALEIYNELNGIAEEIEQCRLRNS